MHHRPSIKGISKHHQSCVSKDSAAVDETPTGDEKELKESSQDEVENHQRGCHVHEVSTFMHFNQLNPISL